MIYFDHAATSFPKPPAVEKAVLEALQQGGNPGRSAHAASTAAGTWVLEAREAIARLLGLKNPMRVAFTLNATQALNTAIRGLARPGCRIVTTAMEHHAVARTLRDLVHSGSASISITRCTQDGRLDLDDFSRRLSNADMAVINHASNVSGTVQDLDAIVRLCRPQGVPVIADASQSIGILDISLSREEDPDILCAPGHKALLGPAGTGFMALHPRFDAAELRPLLCGGTGSLSEKDTQPLFLPDKFESGTLNVPGLAGLAAGITHLASQPGGLAEIRRHKQRLSTHFCAGGSLLPGFKPIPAHPESSTGVVSFQIAECSCSEIAERLWERHGIACRIGLHCAPWAHETLGTFPEGTLRFSFGLTNTEAEIDEALAALQEAIHAS